MDNRAIKRTVIYEALFDDREYDEEYGCAYLNSSIDNYVLENAITKPHVTVSFRPTVTHEDLYGKRAYAILRAYGNDGKNEGYKVELIPRGITTNYEKDKNEEFWELLSNIEIPHITISVSSEGRPVDTRNLKFEELPLIKVEALPVRFGAYVKYDFEDGSYEMRYEYQQTYKI